MVSGIDPSVLREARENAGLTQHELARLIGVAGGERISRWELGTSEPRPDFLVKLASILNIPTLNLIHLTGAVPDLRALRLQAGLAATDLVGRANISKPTYLRWEAGDWSRLPSNPTIESLAHSFEVNADVVIAGFREAQRLRKHRLSEAD